MRLRELRPVGGSRRSRKHVGHDTFNGYGKTSGRGQKGRLARQGGHTRPGFEGDQVSLFRAMPKRDFKSINRREYAVIDLDDLNKFENGNEVTITDLKAEDLVERELSGIRLLANGELRVRVTVKISKTSKVAEEAVNAAGGSVEVI